MLLRNIKIGYYIRLLTSIIRISPNFIIIGAARSGTTSMYNYLNKHPQIIVSKKKEPNYFSFNYNFLNYFIYKSNFPTFLTKFYYRIIKSKRIISCESSTYYLFHPHAAKRLSSKYPKVKIIIMLRNPVERALSHHNLNVSLNRDKLSFHEAILNETKRIEKDYNKLLNDGSFDSNRLHYYSYLKSTLIV